jgi:hypothetical protein
MITMFKVISKMETNIKQQLVSIEDSFVYQVKECIKTLHAIKNILARIKKSKKNSKTELEAEYTKLMISIIVPLLNSFLSEEHFEEFKKFISLKVEYFNQFFAVLRKKYAYLKTNYFDDEEKYLFLRNFDALLRLEKLTMTKSGSVFLRFFLYYLQKLENKVTEVYIKDFELSKEDLAKYAYKVNCHFTLECAY